MTKQYIITLNVDPGTDTDDEVIETIEDQVGQYYDVESVIVHAPTSQGIAPLEIDLDGAAKPPPPTL